jgi:hypothetical protein
VKALEAVKHPTNRLDNGTVARPAPNLPAGTAPAGAACLGARIRSGRGAGFPHFGGSGPPDLCSCFLKTSLYWSNEKEDLETLALDEMDRQLNDLDFWGIGTPTFQGVPCAEISQSPHGIEGFRVFRKREFSSFAGAIFLPAVLPMPPIFPRFRGCFWGSVAD